MQPFAVVPRTYPPVMSREFLDRRIEIPASQDPDIATAQTVEWMCRQIHQSAGDPVLQHAAHSAVQQSRGGPLWAIAGINVLNDARSRERVIADSCFWWAKHYLKFVHHSKLIEVWFGERDQLQLLISPDVLVRSPGQLKGDCAIYTTVICAMLEALGVQWEIVTLATDPSEPEIFGHVYPRAVFSDGGREALDASTKYGKYPGWQVPSSDISRIQVWDESGRPIEDRGSRFNGLHGYVRRRGLAQGEFDVAYENVPVDYSYLNAPVPGATTTYTAPSQSSFDYGAFVTQLLKSGMTLAQINAIPEGTVVDPSGRIIRQTSGYPVPVGSSLSLTGGTGGNMLLIGGLVFAVVIVMVMAGKR